MMEISPEFQMKQIEAALKREAALRMELMEEISKLQRLCIGRKTDGIKRQEAIIRQKMEFLVDAARAAGALVGSAE